MFYLSVRLTSREGARWRSQTGERVQVCLNPCGDKWMREGETTGELHMIHALSGPPLSGWPCHRRIRQDALEWLWISCGPHWSRWEWRWKLDQILTKIWCNLPRRFTAVRNCMNFISNTSSKTVLRRVGKKIHLSKTVLPQKQSRLWSDRFMMAGHLLPLNCPNLWTHHRILMVWTDGCRLHLLHLLLSVASMLSGDDN